MPVWRGAYFVMYIGWIDTASRIYRQWLVSVLVLGKACRVPSTSRARYVGLMWSSELSRGNWNGRNVPSINGRPKILWWITCALSMVLKSPAQATMTLRAEWSEHQVLQ